MVHLGLTTNRRKTTIVDTYPVMDKHRGVPVASAPITLRHPKNDPVEMIRKNMRTPQFKWDIWQVRGKGGLGERSQGKQLSGVAASLPNCSAHALLKPRPFPVNYV